MKRLVLILIVLLPVSALADTFGTETIGAIPVEIGGALIAGAFVANGTGTIDNMSVYLDIGSNPCSVKLAIYLVSGSDDTVLVDTSEKKVVSVGAAWVDFNMQIGGTVFVDSTYYLANRSEDVAGLEYIKIYAVSACSGDPDPVTDCPWVFRTMTWSNAWPATLTSTTKTTKREVSIHCEYKPTPTAAGQVIIIQTE